VGQRDLATLVNYHFKNERKAMRARIESQMTGSLSSTGSLVLPVAPSLPVTPVTVSGTPPHEASSQASVAAAPLPRRLQLPMRPRSLIAAGVGLGAVASLIVALSLGRPAAVTAPPPPSVTAAPPPPTAVAAPSGRISPMPPVPTPSPSPASASPTVQLTIRVEPPQATVTLDGKTISHPFDGEVPRERRTHLVRASAPGFVTGEQMITFAEDTALEIQLAPSRGRGPRPRRRTSAAPIARATTAPPPAEPGTDLQRPAVSAPRRQIDEKDPYSP